MSKSYKKNPVSNDHSAKTTKGKKRQANKKVRNTKDIGQGNRYKKIYDSYDICDFILRYTWKEYLIAEEERVGRLLNKEEIQRLRNDWKRYYRRK